MRFLFFQHTPDDGPDRLGAFLSEQGIDIMLAHVYRDEPIPDPVRYDALVILGGPMSVHDHPRLPYLLKEERQVQRAIAEGIPILGICLGAQILTKALGAEVEPNAVREVGFHRVWLTEEGARDPLLEGFPSEAMVYHWHRDVCAVPPGGFLLASSDMCATQVYRVGSSTYAVQFHPEVTGSTIVKWTEQSRSSTPDERRAMIERSAELEAHLARQASTLFTNFVALV